jgi:hypothetical protein
MELIGYIAALFIGLALGLIGGGGSILTVPVMVYMLGIDPVLATAYSLFVVGSTSVVGAGSYYRKGLVSLKTAMIFGVPSVVMVYLTRKFIVPAIPEEVFSIGSFVVDKSTLLMLIFAVLMIIAAFSMIREKNPTCQNPSDELETAQRFNIPGILTEGAVVGLLTGLVGAGGGFLIIPALVIFSKLKMKLAVGTSLLIIAAKSLIGFLGDLGHYDINWIFLLVFTSLSIVGIVFGSLLSRKVPGEKLKKGFGWFVLAIGIYVLWSELM